MARRSVVVAVGTVAGLLGVGALANHQSRTDYGAYCTNQMQVRVDDSYCQSNYGGYHWYYIPSGSGHSIPPLGGLANGGGIDTPPSSKNIVRGASSAGDSISRGGFGSHSSGSVGG